MTTPILLIPGLNGTADVYLQHLPALWSFGPVTIANHTSGDSVAEIAEAILAAAPPDFALVGFSLGGYIAFEILRRAPQRVTRLALLDSSARPDSPEATQKRRDALALVAQGKFRQVVQNTFATAVHPDHADNAALQARHLAMALAAGPETYRRQQQAIIARPDSRPDLPGIAVPTLVLVGDADQLTPPEVAREMAAAIPGARLVEVAKAGHLALIEQPEIVTAALLDWLQSP